MNCNKHPCDCDEWQTLMLNTRAAERGHISLSDSVDTIQNQNNGSIYDKDTINGSFSEVFETSTLYGSEVDIFCSNDSVTSSLSDTLHDPL